MSRNAQTWQFKRNKKPLLDIFYFGKWCRQVNTKDCLLKAYQLSQSCGTLRELLHRFCFPKLSRPDHFSGHFVAFQKSSRFWMRCGMAKANTFFYESKLIRCYSGLAASHSIGRGNLGTRVMFGNSPPVAHDHPCKRSVIHPSTIGKPQNTLTSFERPWHFYQAITNHTCARRLIVQSKFNDLSGRIVERRVNILFWNRKSYPSILVKCKFNRLIYTSRLEPTKHLLSENSTKRTEAHDYSNIPYEKEALVFRTKATSQRNNCLYSFALGVFANYTPLGEYGYRKHFTAC